MAFIKANQSRIHLNVKYALKEASEWAFQSSGLMLEESGTLHIVS